MWIVGLPLSPFTFTSLDESAKAIREFAAVGDRFVRTVNSLPEKIRWESDLLLYDVAGRGVVTDFLNSSRLVATASRDMVDVTKNLPADVQKEISPLSSSRGPTMKSTSLPERIR